MIPVSAYLLSKTNANYSPWLLPSFVPSADPEEESVSGTAQVAANQQVYHRSG